MSKLTDSTIVMTFSATGWFARIEHSEEERFDAPLICWAVLEYDDQQEVVGLMATDEVVIADENEGFMCYIDADEIKRMAEERAALDRRI